MKKAKKLTKTSRKHYVYIRLDPDIKRMVKKIAAFDRVNMTEWARQTIMKELCSRNANLL